MRISYLFGLSFLSLANASSPALKIPQELDCLIKNQQSLPRYVEASYSPLGRSPVIDAVLNDPFYLPSYAKIVSEKIKKVSQKNKLTDLCASFFKAGGIPIKSTSREQFLSLSENPPDQFVETFGKYVGKQLHTYWLAFLKVSKDIESLLNALNHEEKKRYSAQKLHVDIAPYLMSIMRLLF